MRKKNIVSPIIGLIIVFLIFVVPKHWKVIAAVFVILLIVYFIVQFILSKTTKKNGTFAENNTITEQTQSGYFLKKSLITDKERPYFNAIKKIVEPSHIVQPQINLASIIDKKSTEKFRNELFRNIDFGIFDQNYKPLVLIEINDQTHTTPRRKERDKKVKDICAEAKIPLITLWTNYGVNEDYIKKRISEHIILTTSSCSDPNNTETQKENKHERNDKT